MLPRWIRPTRQFGALEGLLPSLSYSKKNFFFTFVFCDFSHFHHQRARNRITGLRLQRGCNRYKCGTFCSWRTMPPKSSEEFRKSTFSEDEAKFSEDFPECSSKSSSITRSIHKQTCKGCMGIFCQMTLTAHIDWHVRILGLRAQI